MALKFLRYIWSKITGNDNHDDERRRSGSTSRDYSYRTNVDLTNHHSDFSNIYLREPAASPSPRPSVSITSRPPPSQPIRTAPIYGHLESTHINRTVSLPDVKYRFVYRLLRDDESIVNGIRAKLPRANVSIDHHVAYGSRSSSQYISTSASTYAIKKLVGVKIYGALHNIRVVKIDLVLTKQTHPTTRVIDLTDSHTARRHLSSSRAIKFADNFEEVLIEGTVPRSAVTLIYQGSKSMIWSDSSWFDN